MAEIKYDVFISYSRKDYVDKENNIIPNNEVSKILDRLKQEGISYWIDTEGIYSGQDFKKTIPAIIAASSVFLYISSSNSNNSEWTSNEIGTACELKKIHSPYSN